MRGCGVRGCARVSMRVRVHPFSADVCPEQASSSSTYIDATFLLMEGSIVEESMQSTSEPSVSKMPFSPVKTASTCGDDGSIVMMVVAPSAASAGDDAAVAPAEVKSSTAAYNKRNRIRMAMAV